MGKDYHYTYDSFINHYGPIIFNKYCKYLNTISNNETMYLSPFIEVKFHRHFRDKIPESKKPVTISKILVVDTVTEAKVQTQRRTDRHKITNEITTTTRSIKVKKKKPKIGTTVEIKKIDHKVETDIEVLSDSKIVREYISTERMVMDQVDGECYLRGIYFNENELIDKGTQTEDHGVDCGSQCDLVNMEFKSDASCVLSTSSTFNQAILSKDEGILSESKTQSIGIGPGVDELDLFHLLESDSDRCRWGIGHSKIEIGQLLSALKYLYNERKMLLSRMKVFN